MEACKRTEMMLVEERAMREAGERNNQNRLEGIAQNQNELQTSITAMQQQLQGIINQMQMINQGGNENSLREKSFSREVEKVHNQALAQTVQPSTPSRFAPFRRIEFPCFNGEDPQSWIEKCDEYFQVLFTIPENKRVDLAYIYFEGDAKMWFREYLEERDTPTWDDFVAMIFQKYALNEVNSGKEVEQIDESCLFEKMPGRIISKVHLIDEVFVQNFGAPSEIEVNHMVLAEMIVKENRANKMFDKMVRMEFNELNEVDSNKMDVTFFTGFKQWKIKRFIPVEPRSPEMDVKKENNNNVCEPKKYGSAVRFKKQLLRDRIVDMLTKAGWTIEYGQRVSKDYQDAVYVDREGRGYWSVTLAYKKFKERIDEGKAEDREISAFSSILAETLSMLFRVTEKGKKAGKKSNAARTKKKNYQKRVVQR